MGALCTDRITTEKRQIEGSFIAAGLVAID
jgi:hypothetical protein